MQDGPDGRAGTETENKAGNEEMKRLVISAVLSTAIMAAGIPAIAQTATDTQSGTNSATTQATPNQGYGHHGRGAHMRQMMMSKLNLTQQQQDQLTPIFQKQRDAAKAIKQDTTLTPDQRKQKFDALRQDTQAQVNSVLTPEQQQQWAQMKAQGKQRMAANRQKMGARMAEKLNLSQAQQDQIKPLMQKQREQAKAIWQDNSLTQDQKRTKMQQLHQDTQAQLNSILTPDQQQQWQQMRQNFRQHRHGQGPATDSQPAPQGA
jgi:Spy/CpxP family protein refolding chaperone